MDEFNDHSRYYNFNDGRDFVAPLLLAGWDVRSVWGLDNRSRTFFAGLWENGQHTPVPNYALFSGKRYYQWPACIAADLVDLTERDPLSVIRAMAIADPAPRLRPLELISREAATGRAHGCSRVTDRVARPRSDCRGGRCRSSDPLRANLQLRPDPQADLLRRRQRCTFVGAWTPRTDHLGRKACRPGIVIPLDEPQRLSQRAAAGGNSNTRSSMASGGA
jgi:hypothetical protein